MFAFGVSNDEIGDDHLADRPLSDRFVDRFLEQSLQLPERRVIEIFAPGFAQQFFDVLLHLELVHLQPSARHGGVLAEQTDVEVELGAGNSV